MSTGNACFTLAPITPSFSPLNYPGLIAWYDSVNSPIFDEFLNVIALKDNSLNHNNLIALNGTSPLIIGSPYNGINLTGGVNTFVNTIPIEFQNKSSGLTIFIVATNPTTPFPFNYISIFNDNSSMGAIQVLSRDMYADDAQLHSQISINPQNNNYGNYISGPYLNISESTLITAISFNSNYTSAYYNSNYSASTYQNGELANIYNTLPNININTSNINTFNITIGDDGNNKNGETHVVIGLGISITLYEIIIYNNVLSTTNISDINNYLQNKYNTPLLSNDGIFNY